MRKMRLINADSIKFEPYYDKYVDYDGYINDLKTWQLDDILSDRVDNTPTVNAIPVEWIKNYARKICADDGGRYNSKAYGIDRMIYDWEKENES